jgi:GntR family transcriptional regulator
MKNSLDDNKPIFLQIKEQIEDSIINGEFNPEDKVPSTNEFASFYKINPATAGKGINELVAEGILYKRRGVGMFVTEEARDILIESRKKLFYEKFMLPLKKEAEKLGMDREDLIQMMKRGDSHED